MNQVINSTVVATNDLQAFGLVETDLEQVNTLVSQIDTQNMLTVSQFGRSISEHTANYADGLLAQVKNSDLDDMGEKLDAVVFTAKKLNLNALNSTKSKIPLIGTWIDRFKLSKEQFVQQFDTTKEQIDALILQVDTSKQNLAHRVTDLEAMFHSVKDEYRLIGMHIMAGTIKLDEIQALIVTKQAMAAQSPVYAQELSDLEAILAMLDKRVGDLRALQHAALQSLPMLRMIQVNNQMLVEKCNTIRELTIPAWKRQFMLALSLKEQQNAVALVESIDNATNDFLLQNAELLRKNSVAAAKANQRLVIDVDTLEQAQKILISTVQDVIKVRQEGVQKRKDVVFQLENMRVELQQRLTSIGSDKVH